MRIPGWEKIASGERKLNQKAPTMKFTPRDEIDTRETCGKIFELEYSANLNCQPDLTQIFTLRAQPDQKIGSKSDYKYHFGYEF